MGFGSRLGKIASGIGGALQAPFGLVKDFAIAPWKDEDDYDQFVNTVYKRTKVRGGQVLKNLFGPEEGLGAAIGALPKGIRTPAKTVLDPALGALEDVGHGIDVGLSSAMTAASLQQAGAGFDLGRAKRLVEKEDRSFGQSVALAFGTKDILDEKEVVRFQGTDSYEIISGTADIIKVFKADPTVLLGRGAKAARTKYVTRPVKSYKDMDRAMPLLRGSSKRADKWVDEVLKNPESDYLRTRFFSENRFGAAISDALADAAQKGEVPLRRMTRVLMGDMEALAPLRAESAALAAKAGRMLKDVGDPRVPAGDLKLVMDEVDELFDATARTSRIESAFQQIKQAPRATTAGKLRTNVVRSEIYQKSPFAAPLRTVFNMRPHNIIQLDDMASDIQLDRMLAKAKVGTDIRGSFRQRYMSAAAPERIGIVAEAEAAAVTKLVLDKVSRELGTSEGLAKDALRRVRGERKPIDLPEDEFKQVMEKAREDVQRVLESSRSHRTDTETLLNGRVYDGEGRSKVIGTTEDGFDMPTEIPLAVTQNANVLPLPDIEGVSKAAGRIAEFRARFPQSELPTEVMEMATRYWKKGVLLRLGYPVRVTTEETFRQIAKIGALTHFKGLSGAVARNVKARMDHVPKELRLSMAKQGDELVPRTLNVETPTANYELLGPWDTKGLFQALNSADSSWKGLVGDLEKESYESLIGSGQWRSVTPDEPSYAQAWERDVNLQIAQDQVGRQFLQGKSPEEVTKWATSTPEGISYIRQLPKYRRQNLQATFDDYHSQVMSYVPEELRETVLNGRVSADDLVKLRPDPSTRPIVHGEILAESRGQGVVGKTIDGIIDRGMKSLATTPTNVVSRNRFFEAMYTAESTRLVNLADDVARRSGRQLDSTDLERISGQSRHFATGEVKKYLYDLAETSELGHMLRFFVPFYNAWQEVITRWAGLSIENPEFVAKMRLVWNSPEKAGLITDENGLVVDENGDGYDPMTDKKVGKAGEDRYVTVQLMPEVVQDILGSIPGAKELEHAKFNKKSLNLALQGTPGFGPTVQIPVNEIVKDRPELEESVKFILPFGTTNESWELAKPTVIKRLSARSAGEENRQFFNSQMRIYFDMLTDYNLGNRDEKPTWKEANRQAKDLYNLRTWVSWVAPVAFSYDSPYQIYIDQYRRLKESDPETADEKFLAQHKEEYFALTQSLSRSMDGVPPTIEGYQARKKYLDMIEKYPDLGGLIVGSEGAGEFARAVYDSQLTKPLRPGSGTKQREKPDFEAAAERPSVRLGWMKYRKAMDLIEAERIDRGLPNLQVKEADDLSKMKRKMIEAISAEHPEWQEEFSVVDRGKMKRRIDGMSEIAADPRLQGRNEFRVLKQYLDARQLVIKELRSRGGKKGGAKTLDAVSNQDLAKKWQVITGKLIESDLAFGDLFYRYLERDQLVG